MLNTKKLVDTYRVKSDAVNEDTRRVRRARPVLVANEDGELEDRTASPKRGRIKPRKGVPKDFGENLAPLQRFLQGSVGKNWDKVYSEIARRFDRRSVLGAHVYQHLWSWVERNPRMIDGLPHKPQARWDGVLTPLVCSGKAVYFYVDPRDGCLKKAPSAKSFHQKWKEANRRQREDIRWVREFEYLSRCNITKRWYRLIYVPIPRHPEDDHEFRVQQTEAGQLGPPGTDLMRPPTRHTANFRYFDRCLPATKKDLTLPKWEGLDYSYFP